MKREDFNNNWVFEKMGGQARAVDLPHDAMIEEERSPDCPSGSAGAFFPGGLYTYSKTFIAPKEWENQTVTFQFEGVYKNGSVCVLRLAGACRTGAKRAVSSGLRA